jgi:hypothetical protein
MGLGIFKDRTVGELAGTERGRILLLWLSERAHSPGLQRAARIVLHHLAGPL